MVDLKSLCSCWYLSTEVYHRLYMGQNSRVVNNNRVGVVACRTKSIGLILVWKTTSIGPKKSHVWMKPRNLSLGLSNIICHSQLGRGPQPLRCGNALNSPPSYGSVLRQGTSKPSQIGSLGLERNSMVWRPVATIRCYNSYSSESALFRIAILCDISYCWFCSWVEKF